MENLSGAGGGDFFINLITYMWPVITVSSQHKHHLRSRTNTNTWRCCLMTNAYLLFLYLLVRAKTKKTNKKIQNRSNLERQSKSINTGFCCFGEVRLPETVSAGWAAGPREPVCSLWIGHPWRHRWKSQVGRSPERSWWRRCSSRGSLHLPVDIKYQHVCRSFSKDGESGAPELCAFFWFSLHGPAWWNSWTFNIDYDWLRKKG